LLILENSFATGIGVCGNRILSDTIFLCCKKMFRVSGNYEILGIQVAFI
jgi:hypothetical protein